MLLAAFGTGQVFWSMVWFFLWFIWIWLLITLFADIFRSDDLGGWGKALWTIFIIFVPFLGVFVYLIARGSTMQERRLREAASKETAFRGHVQDIAASNGDAADEIAKFLDLRDRGVITEAEFQQAKARALA